MPSSSKLVNTSEAFELRLVHFLGNHDATSPFVLKCESIISEGNASSLLRTIFDHGPALDVLFDKKDSFKRIAGGSGSSDDGIHAFSLLCALLDGIEEEKDMKEVMELVVGKIEQYQIDKTTTDGSNGGDDGDHGDDKGSENHDLVEKKLKMLCALYNLRHDGKEKCWILSRILHTCAFGGDDESVLSLLPDRDSTLGKLLERNNLGNLLAGLEKEGNQTLSSTDKRVLYSTASAVSAKVEKVCKEKGMLKEATTANGSSQRFLLKMLSTYSSIDDVDEDARNAATNAAVGAICDPIALFNEQRCIMSLPPVMALQNDPGMYTISLLYSSTFF